MQIIDDQQRRLGDMLDQPDQKPEQAVERAIGAIVLEHRVGLIEQTRGEPGRAAEHARTAGRVQVTQRPIEELMHDRERELTLEFPTAPTEDKRTTFCCQRRRAIQERCLADPRRTLDQHRPTMPGTGLVEQITDNGDLGVALE
jgi:hypothetical protein